MKNLIVLILALFPLIAIAQQSTEYQSLQKQIDSLTHIVIQDKKFIGSLNSIFYYYDNIKIPSRRVFYQRKIDKNTFKSLRYKIVKHDLTRSKYTSASIYVQSNTVYYPKESSSNLHYQIRTPSILKTPATQPLLILALIANRKNKRKLKKKKPILQEVYRKDKFFEYILIDSEVSLIAPFIDEKKIEKLKVSKELEDLRAYMNLNGVIWIQLKNADDFLKAISAITNNKPKQ